jgi:hypothetical protein
MGTTHRRLFGRVFRAFEFGGAVAMRAALPDQKNMRNFLELSRKSTTCVGFVARPARQKQDRWRFLSRRLPLTLIPNFKEQAPKRF